MDLPCPKCGEPWDNDEFHEVAVANDYTYQAVAADFRARGCAALDSPDTETAAHAAVLYEALGDDMDGAASEFSL